MRPLTDRDAAPVADVHSWYGIQRVQLAPSAGQLAGGIRRLAPQRKRRGSRAAAVRSANPAQMGGSLMPGGTLPDLCRARDYLAARFNERVSLADAAAAAGLSPFYFHRLFAAAFSETPHEFVTRLRIDHAKKLLLAGNHSVTDICFDAGYESLGSFSSRFHSTDRSFARGFPARIAARVRDVRETLAAVLHARLLSAFLRQPSTDHSLNGRGSVGLAAIY